MQIHSIIKSLIGSHASGGMATSLSAAGFVGGLHHGLRAAKSAAKPFGLINCEEVESVGNSSGVKLVTYIATLDIVADQKIETVGPILQVFHDYWDRLVDLTDLNPNSLDQPPARFILIRPAPDRAASQIGEDDREDLGQDVLLGITAWLIKLSEHQPELE